nr:hypothetical protein [Citricoccus sp. CH26A]
MNAGFGAGRQGALKATAFVGVSALAVTGAILYPGFQTADVDLNDGGVWVVNREESKVAHLNYQSQTLDGGVTTTMTEYDLAQHADQVYLRDREIGALVTVDPAAFELTDENMLPANAGFSYGQDVVAVVDAERGRVYAASGPEVGAMSSDGAEPLYEAEGRVAAAVGRDDTVWIADLDADLITGFRPLTESERREAAATERVGTGADGGQGEDGAAGAGDASPGQPAGFREIVSTEVDGLKGLASPQVSAVGDTGVVFDAASGTLVTSEGRSSTVVDPAGEGSRRPDRRRPAPSSRSPTRRPPSPWTGARPRTQPWRPRAPRSSRSAWARARTPPGRGPACTSGTVMTTPRTSPSASPRSPPPRSWSSASTGTWWSSTTSRRATPGWSRTP